MNKPIIRNFILIGIPTIISAIGIIMTQDFLSNFKNFFFYLTIVLLLLFIGFVIYYAKLDKNEELKYVEINNKNENLQKEIDNLKMTITSTTNLLNTNNSIVTSFVSIIEPMSFS